jgi:excinuclease ABC subunit A
MDTIRIRGARTHNLANIDLDLPRDKLIVITGLSGSGKSSLAFDTIYAEGQRRYVESLSAYARQFLSMMEKPDVDHIEGLSPAISIEQKSTSHNPRSTVGTITEIYDYLRLLFARVGRPCCPDHGIPLEAQTISQMVDHVLNLPEGTRLMLMAPMVRDRKGEHLQLIGELRAQGFVRARVDGTVYDLDDVPPLELRRKHTIEVVVDRIRVREDLKQRLAESFETAITLTDGLTLISPMDEDSALEEKLFSARYSCPYCDYSLQELEPRMFSFNNPNGACPECDGLGVSQFFDPERVVSSTHVSLAGGAIRGWDRRNAYYFQIIQALARYYEFDVDTPFEDLPKPIREVILYGSGDEVIEFRYFGESGVQKRRHPFAGIIPNLERRYRETDSRIVREELAKYISQKPCPGCEGQRLNREARHVFVADTNLPTITAWPIERCLEYFNALELEGRRREIVRKIVKEVHERLHFLVNVGLDYLTLDRKADTLSGGEAQRIRLASQIGAGLVGVMYILDEPSIGLHQRDNARLLATLTRLRDLGNTVIVVEHDEEAIRSADYVVDIGPGAGVHGGRIVFHGTPQDLQADPEYSDSPRAPARRPRACHEGGRRQRQQSEKCHAGNPGRPVRLRHGRVRLRQVNADQRHAAPARCPGVLRQHGAAGALCRYREPGAVRQGGRHRSVAHRAHAPLQPGDLHRPVYADTRPVRGHAGGAGPRVQTRPFQFQCQGRPLRGLPGRRPDSRRDALPARHLRALRRVQGQTVQPRNPERDLQGQEHPRGAADDGRRGPRLFRPGAGRGAQTADHGRRGALVHHAGPERDHPVRR